MSNLQKGRAVGEKQVLFGLLALSKLNTQKWKSLYAYVYFCLRVSWIRNKGGLVSRINVAI